MRMVMYGVVLGLVPLVLIQKLYPDANPAPFILIMVAAVVFVQLFEKRESARDYNMLMQDAEAFGKVVRQYWIDEPLLATALWKKVHPKCPPPWHQPPEEEG